MPTQALVWHFISVEVLAQPASLGTTLSFPPGYLRAFRYNLACELAAELGVEPSAQVKRIAMVAKRDLKRINNPNDLMAMPASLIMLTLPDGERGGEGYGVAGSSLADEE